MIHFSGCVPIIRTIRLRSVSVHTHTHTLKICKDNHERVLAGWSGLSLMITVICITCTAAFTALNHLIFSTHNTMVDSGYNNETQFLPSNSLQFSWRFREVCQHLTMNPFLHSSQGELSKFHLWGRRRGSFG